MRAAFAVAAAAAVFLALSGAAHAAGDAAAGETKAATCVACHGPAGNSTQANTPSLAAQPPLYIYYQLIQFREKRRSDPLMSPMAANLSDRDMQDLAAYFTAQKAVNANTAADSAKAEKGAAAARREHCESCHAKGFVGQQHIPRLAGQGLDYLRVQLKGFRSGTRPDIDGSMASSSQTLSDDDIENLSAFLATFPQ
jgi:cytochrome c553